jgi:hypothetical protein
MQPQFCPVLYLSIPFLTNKPAFCTLKPAINKGEATGNVALMASEVRGSHHSQENRFSPTSRHIYPFQASHRHTFIFYAN